MYSLFHGYRVKEKADYFNYQLDKVCVGFFYVKILDFFLTHVY